MDFRKARLVLWGVLIAMMVLLSLPAFANQVGVNWAEGTIGGLGDYRQVLGAWEFEVDAQAQRTDAVSLVSNASVQRNFGDVGFKPFLAYTRDAVGNTFDVGGLLNFSIGALDIAAGASFRGADPTKSPRFDPDGFTTRAGYNPETGTWLDANAYSLPAVNNINGVANTGFEKWNVETDLTVYVPITQRDLVPVIVISRSQTSIDLPFLEGLAASFVVDARSYIHGDGVEISFTPIGGIVYKFRGF